MTVADPAIRSTSCQRSALEREETAVYPKLRKPEPPPEQHVDIVIPCNLIAPFNADTARPTVSGTPYQLGPWNQPARSQGGLGSIERTARGTSHQISGQSDTY